MRALKLICSSLLGLSCMIRSLMRRYADAGMAVSRRMREDIPLLSLTPMNASPSRCHHLFQILIGERAHLIEFPSLLLPPGVTSGSIVNISVNRNISAEEAHKRDFWSLQDEILQAYGLAMPKAPLLKLRHVTQTSVTLEWDSLELAQASCKGLEIYKNGQRLALIPNPTTNTSTKLSSLQSNEEYSFHLVL